ncbi:hypothetical protein MBIO_0590 [Mycoplasmopsis fermentans PG18]|uniref:Uncharacterized protein n=3 Tax=Mycoplasmopsis fermentans TaxID=2115 RepID=C4XFD3_MYCFP|nr:hypothetical protein [Mycoplasmopsis fermentans]BAH69855.1 hypothetical protein MBIO_0590 [Mycoplasmopsis fermentans PG18]
MATINLKAYNYSPDFKNESLINRGNNLIKDVKLKNIEGFEHFGFHELALNFSNFNVDELNNFVRLIKKQEIKEILIMTTSKIIDNYQAGNDFLFKYDLLKKYKLKFNFINVDNYEQDYYAKFEEYKKKFEQKGIALMFGSFTKFSE